MGERRDATGTLGAAFDLIERFVADGAVDGAALAVAVDGRPVAEGHAGFAAPGLPAAADVRWPLASISKLYTAAAVMALVERGALTLATPVSAVLPRFAGSDKARVTLLQLLTHTAGVPYESPEMAGLLARQTPLDAIVDEVYERSLLFAPGARHSYSDLGYALAGRMAAAVADVPFPDLVRTRVLEPAGLAETGMPASGEDDARTAHVVGSLAYGTAGAMYNSPYALRLGHPAFGTVANVADLLRFGLLFAPGGPRIFSEATVRAMTTNQLGDTPAHDADPPLYPAWGLGFMLRGARDPLGFFGDLLPAGTFGHGGASGCALFIDPADGVTIAFVSNRHLSADPAAFGRRLGSVANVVMACLTR